MIARRIRLIAIMVSCSLAGILLLQGYWLYNSYRLSTQQFEKEVLDVLKRLEHGHALAEIESMGFFVDSTGKNDTARLARMVDFLLTGPHLPPIKPTHELPKDRRIITESKMMVAMLADSLNITQHGKADSLMKIRKRVGDTKFMDVGAGKQVFTVNTNYDYTESEFAEFSTPLVQEIDSLLQEAGIGSTYAFKLSNFNGGGDTYVSDRKVFNGQLRKADRNAKIGVAKPYRLTLAIANDMGYILKNMLWVLMASLAIVGITAWAYVVMLRTIFQQKRLSDIKTDFINNMTHEFKTPIATVSLAVEALQHFDVMKKPEQTREYLDICRNELNRISVMVEKVLKMAAFERLDIKLSLQKTDIGKMVADVVENMRPQWEKREAKVNINTEGGVEANVDRTHMANVVYNLIDNSLKYTDKIPEIEIFCGITDSRQVRLTVRDNGVGIPSTYLARIFENFFRVPTGNIHNAKGFGLGLGYVATIVKKHRGNIDVKSTVGTGSTFTIVLPTDGFLQGTN
ncbi:sensor histidine kinase [Parapedobacter defluvii]|nr:HAMP domain-containing sensor histidine kinase [Parapedobacter defluvii]